MKYLCILNWLFMGSLLISPYFAFIIKPPNINIFGKYNRYHITRLDEISNLKKNPDEKSIVTIHNNTQFQIIQNKITGLVTVIRPVNILPTLFLTLFGGWVVHPSYTLFLLPKFLITMVDTVIIMSSSMIINDIYDVDIDRHNNPNRPLVKGIVTIQEAVLFSVFLLTLAEYFNISFLSSNLQWVVHASILNIVLYTPVFKKITFVKNLSCASLVTLSIFFGALSTDTLLGINDGFTILTISLSLVFLGSLYNELLLDMCDLEGDKQHNIYTIPVVVGNKNSWVFASFILYSNIFLNSLELAYLYNSYIGSMLAFICIPFIQDLYKIKQTNYSKEIITSAVKKSSDIMFVLFIYLGAISYYM